MKFEISYVYYQYLGYSWVTYWRNNIGIKRKKKKGKKEKKWKRIILIILSFLLSNQTSCLIKH
jgi:polyferredoxin